MRIKNAIRNSLYSVCCYAITTVLLFVSRRLFIDNLDLEFLGYDGLFKEVISFVALADLGVGGAITYRLYDAVAQRKELEVAKLMKLYKYIYLALGGIIFLGGICLIPLLPYLIKDTNLSFSYICLIYILQLTGTGSSYFLGYNRIRFLAEQKEYITVKIDLLVNILAQVLRIIILMTVCSYAMYAAVVTIQNIGANLWILIKYKQLYNTQIKIKLNRQDITQLKIIHDFKNFIPHKIASFIYSGTDNIVISAILGISQVALFTNYTLVASQVNAVINKAVQPLMASIANMVYKETKGKNYRLFRDLDFLFFCIGVYLCVGMVSVFQPFIALWVGDKYIQRNTFVCL